MTASERIEKIRSVIENNPDYHINIIVAQVDPDAIGSALGLWYIIKHLGGNAVIWYAGGIGHPQNRSIVNRYDLSKLMKPIDTYRIAELDNEEDEINDIFALVDSSSTIDSRLGKLSGKFSATIIVDHHRSDATEDDGDMIWVEDIGSACTMIIELLMEMEIKFEDQYSYIPVIMAMGVYSDTKKLVSACDRDITAYNYISRQMSSQEFNGLVNYPLPDTYFANFSTALSNAVISGSRLVTYIGKVSEKQGDDLSTIADMLIRRDSITLVVVWGIIGNKIRFSARNDDITTPLNDLLRECFGDKSGAKLTPDGQGEGGGLIELELGFLDGDDALSEIIALIKKRMETVIFSSK